MGSDLVARVHDINRFVYVLLLLVLQIANVQLVHCQVLMVLHLRLLARANIANWRLIRIPIEVVPPILLRSQIR